ncbi:hypothetical protein H310_08413 [Aphanomyces invadans]|uniref:CCHC-type domain-containing protein n=1 Tax=Aphanomyces invadans TaxID=157072 RepID=A0A024TY82_9STRA|nr:hypothetical protein H310_08413 [Aphanomyces invadans]ETV98924.1 hypothetical protein H310_08413 [Aphanomyces invadans]|eukprot:XP_008872352.1 hypothetical protein H310_08413 [Aphanomyces invadans]
MTVSNQTVYDRMVDILGEGDTQSLFSPIFVDTRARLLEGIGITLNPADRGIRALEESLHQSEGQAKAMREHSSALQTEVAQLRDRSSTLQFSVSPAAPASSGRNNRRLSAHTKKLRLRTASPNNPPMGVKPVKLDVTKFESNTGKLLRLRSSTTTPRYRNRSASTSLWSHNHGPTHTQLFRVYAASFEEAVRIALAKSYASALTHNRADPSDMYISALSQIKDGKCSNCGRKGHFWRECRALDAHSFPLDKTRDPTQLVPAQSTGSPFTTGAPKGRSTGSPGRSDHQAAEND